jgi:DNA-directed RNA polymerase subunit RPC12/RpoP
MAKGYIQCPYCGAHVKKNVLVCEYCGMEVILEETPPPQPTPPPTPPPPTPPPAGSPRPFVDNAVNKWCLALLKTLTANKGCAFWMFFGWWFVPTVCILMIYFYIYYWILIGWWWELVKFNKKP